MWTVLPGRAKNKEGIGICVVPGNLGLYAIEGSNFERFVNSICSAVNLKLSIQAVQGFPH